MDQLILGIDPGSHKTGYAVLQLRGRRLSVVQSGTIRLPAKAPLVTRLGELLERLETLLDTVSPQAVAVEDVFSHRNARSALALGQARGVVLGAVGRRGLELAAYPPATVKRAVSGHGAADKGQIQQMVRLVLGLEVLPQEDEADAMALAICHSMSGSLPSASEPRYKRGRTHATPRRR